MLTAEELKQSTGEYLWVENLDVSDCIVQIQEVNDLYIDLSRANMDIPQYCTYHMKNYGKTWLAYRLEENHGN